MPPARKSISHSIVFHGNGQNQGISSFGAVQASQIFSRGTSKMTFNPELDLQFERIVDVPREKIWEAWITPKLLMPWFCPLPWKTIECEIDLRAGGIFVR